MTFKKVLHTYHCHRLIKSDNILHFLTKQCPFTQNFAKQTKKFYKTKSSQNYFLPLKTPLPKSETQNLTKSQFFLGHPVVQRPLEALEDPHNPSKGLKLKDGLKGHFFGTPCSFLLYTKNQSVPVPLHCNITIQQQNTAFDVKVTLEKLQY